MLKQLRLNSIGHLGYLEGDFETCQAEWNGILDQMIEGFEAAYKLTNMQWKDEADRKALGKKFDKGFKLFHKHYFQLWN